MDRKQEELKVLPDLPIVCIYATLGSKFDAVFAESVAVVDELNPLVMSHTANIIS